MKCTQAFMLLALAAAAAFGEVEFLPPSSEIKVAGDECLNVGRSCDQFDSLRLRKPGTNVDGSPATSIGAFRPARPFRESIDLSPDQLRTRILTVRKKLWQFVGPLPERPNSWSEDQVKIYREVSRKTNRGTSFRQQYFHFTDGFGLPVTGQILIPDSALGLRVPAVLYHHYHGGDFPLGTDELLHADKGWLWGEALVNAGYIVMGIDTINHGRRFDPKLVKDGADSQNLLNDVLSMYGLSRLQIRTHDDLLALRLLRNHSLVNPRKVATMGMSMGSARTQMLMALAGDQLAAGVALGTIARHQDSIAQDKIRNNTNNHFFPGQLQAGIDTEAVVAAAAGTPFRLIIGKADAGSPGWPYVIEYNKWAWNHIGAGGRFFPVIMTDREYPGVEDSHDASHNWHPAEFRKTLEWLKARLQ
jgi:hypothetical protein